MNPVFDAFINDTEWDFPFFKKLRKNDSGSATSNQAGTVIVKEIRKYFPILDHRLAAIANPTVDEHIEVEMFDGLSPISLESVRYQYQTWGRGRSPEARVTDGTLALRRLSRTDDYLIMQRRRNDLLRFRFILVKQRNEHYQSIRRLAGNRRWGPLYSGYIPVSQTDINTANDAIYSQTLQDFSLNNTIDRQTSIQSIIARSAVFRKILVEQYNGRCAISGVELSLPSGAREIEAAHIVPLKNFGPDEPRNGILLNRSLHWAFDRGLFSISESRRVVISPRTAPESRRYLEQFHNQRITEASTTRLRSASEAFRWHREHFSIE